MKKMIESITGGYVSSAKVVDGALILSLPDAISPVVWRMDLTSVKSSALEVRDQKDGTFMLTLKTPRDDVTNIAPFTEKAIAVRALMAVSYALEHGQGHSHLHTVKTVAANEMAAMPHYNPGPPPAEGGATKWVLGIAAVLVLFVMIAVLSYNSPRSNSFAGNGGGFSTASSALPPSNSAIAPNTAASGVPVPADDFLRENGKPQ